MVASTISNSGGPGSPTELSPVTIAVRDKVIEKFKDQPLREMNESLKMLLSKEQDEQKRLGILAARVFILRQRITTLAEPDPERVVSTASPAPKDTEAANNHDDVEAGDDTSSEWTRLRILDDCEVNGVRFPKTVIIDVKSADAQRLIDSGNAELMDEPLVDAGDTAEADSALGDDSGAPSAMQTELDSASPAGEAGDDDDAASEGAGDGEGEDDSLDALQADIPAMETSLAPEPDEAVAAEAADEPAAEAVEEPVAADDQPVEEEKEAVIEAPSAAEVTAALAALGSDSNALDDPAPEADSTNDDPAAADDEAAAVAAELEAAAAAMAAPSADPEAADSDGSAKPGGWFEAQQNAEKAAKAETGDDQETEQKDESRTDET